MSLRRWPRAAIWSVVIVAGLLNAPAALAAKGGSSSACVRKATCSPSATDTAAPSISIASPAAGSTLAGAVTVSGSASDNAAIARVDIAVDGATWTLASGTTAWSASVNTASYADGSHTVAARATDTSGNSAVTSRTVTFANGSSTAPTPPADTTKPTVAITSPQAGATVTGSINVTGSSADNAAVAKVEVAVDGGSWSTASGTSTWSAPFISTGYANGSHTIAARATDTSGNVSAITSVSVNVSNTSSGGSTAPATQGTWTSPEGVKIEVNSAGPWTIARIYEMLKENASAPGDFSRIAPSLTIKVQDATASQTAAGASSTNGVYTSYSATIYLKGVNSTFSTQPDSQLAHEYGHAWTMYHLYLTHQDDWQSYLSARWTTADGSKTLATDARLDSSYTWDRAEIIGDDYRLLFGSALAISQRNTHMNSEIPDPRNVAGLRNFFLETWA